MAVDWQNYQKVILPDVPNLHEIDVYINTQKGYQSSREVVLGNRGSRADVINYVKSANIRGRGGAGFNCGLKWSFMPPKKPGIPRYLACNGDESEPGTYKDRRIFEFNPHLFIEGVTIACWAMEMDAAYVYIRGEYADWIDMLQKAVDQAYNKGFVGKNIYGSDFSFDIHLHKGAGAYICGEETSLMESLEGKRAYPRSKPPFPAQAGLWSKPTTINNIDTLGCVTLVMRYGAEWFANLGAKDHPGPFLYGLQGHVNRPGLYEYPSGMLLTDLIYKVGGGIRNGKKLKAVVPGGASVPILRADMIEGVTLNTAALNPCGALIGQQAFPLSDPTVQAILDDPAQKAIFMNGGAIRLADGKIMRKIHSFVGTAGTLVMDEDTDIVRFSHRTAQFFHHESCGQCTPCREGCGWMEKLLYKFVKSEASPRDMDILLDLCDQMEGRTVCALADAAAWPVRNVLHRFEDEFKARVKATEVFALA
jgi:NADH-quinone oxidoreductase subunit F